MKYCTKCGAELLDDAVLCPRCGSLADNSANNGLGVRSGGATNLPTKMNTCSLLGFILSLVGLLFYFNIFGMVSLASVVLSIVGLVQISKNFQRGKGFAIAGLVVGICMFMFCLLVWIMAVGEMARS